MASFDFGNIERFKSIKNDFVEAQKSMKGCFAEGHEATKEIGAPIIIKALEKLEEATTPLMTKTVEQLITAVEQAEVTYKRLESITGGAR